MQPFLIQILNYHNVTVQTLDWNSSFTVPPSTKFVNKVSFCKNVSSWY